MAAGDGPNTKRDPLDVVIKFDEYVWSTPSLFSYFYEISKIN